MKKGFLIAIAFVALVGGTVFYLVTKPTGSTLPTAHLTPQPISIETPTPVIERTKGETIEINKGDEFSIALESNPTTGYEWQYGFNSSYLELVDREYIPASQDPTIVGAGGSDKFTFRATRIGGAQITFWYVRSWEEDTPPIKEVLYLIRIK